MRHELLFRRNESKRAGGGNSTQTGSFSTIVSLLARPFLYLALAGHFAALLPSKRVSFVTFSNLLDLVYLECPEPAHEPSQKTRGGRDKDGSRPTGSFAVLVTLSILSHLSLPHLHVCHRYFYN